MVEPMNDAFGFSNAILSVYGSTHGERRTSPVRCACGARLRVFHPLPVPLDVVGGQIVAVVELDALVDVENVRLAAVLDLPVVGRFRVDGRAERRMVAVPGGVVVERFLTGRFAWVVERAGSISVASPDMPTR